VSLIEGSGASYCFFGELRRDLDFNEWYRPCSTEDIIS
jgi:hypothetical protein